MSRPNNTLKSNQDDRLADFTDEALVGQGQQSASTVDEELLLLEETVLRLRTAYPPVTLDEARVKQMRVRLKNRIKREEQEAKQPFWKKWLSLPQAGIVMGALSLLIVFILVFPSLTTAGSSTTATALTPTQGPWVAAGLAGVILFILWIKRRK